MKNKVSERSKENRGHIKIVDYFHVIIKNVIDFYKQDFFICFLDYFCSNDDILCRKIGENLK